MSNRIVRETAAVYAALANLEDLRRGPIFIEKEGRTQAVLLDIERYESLVRQAGFQNWIDEIMAPLQPEIEAYQQMLPDLLKKHEGKWVAIHQGKIVALSSDRQEVNRQVV